MSFKVAPDAMVYIARSHPYVEKRRISSVCTRMTAERTTPPDRLVAAVDERRPALLDVIRGAQHRLTLSLFRCNDDAVFEELASAVARGVVVEVLVTSRAKGG